MLNTMKNESAPCHSTDYLKACREFAARLPCCGAVLSTISANFNKPKNLLAPLNFMDLFEMRDALVDTGRFKFLCTTWCMYPVIKRGDMVNILSAKIGEVDTGDVAVFRTHGFLLAHRVIDKRTIKNRPCLITRPDRSIAGEDPPLFEEDLVGKVSSVIRNGKRLDVDKREPKRIGVFFCNMTILYFQNLWAGQRKIRDIIEYIQGFKFYRSIAKKIFSNAKSKLNFRIGMPVVNKASAKAYIYTRLKKDSFADKDLKEKLKWHLIIDSDSEPIGYMNFLKRPQDCPHSGFWISDIFIRTRFRGAEFGIILMKKAKAILKDRKIPEMSVGRFLDDKRASNFFKKIGFEEKGGGPESPGRSNRLYQRIF